MTIDDITKVIEDFAPLKLQESYDNAGLITGRPDSTAKGALFCVDVTEEVLEECISLGVNLIISHHPLIFHPLKKITGSNNVESLLIKAVKNDIALYSCHTNLDSTENGVSYRMAEMLGLRNISVLVPYQHNSKCGFGIIGDLEEETDSLNFLKFVKETFKSGTVRHSVIDREKISRVAVSSGSGGSFMENAIDAGADIFVTADLRYNTFLDAAGRIIVADIGHFESEYCTIEILYGIVKKNFPKFAAYKSVNSINPVIYLS
ncbi:MAG: Nif3-like dinuclear metal center hexameric protein [Rikenellaceae bacterium]|nr:Nif3-like dinuclear metal center hexameric protein [Rikenellaceae bacterium]